MTARSRSRSRIVRTRAHGVEALVDDYRVRFNLQRSGSLITAAALIPALSFLVYATSHVMLLQMLGIGVAIAILVDATLVRAILVPSFMRLAGPLNWWAPGPLRRFHQRYGVSDVAAVCGAAIGRCAFAEPASPHACGR